MLWTLIRKEIQENLYSFKFLIVFLLLTVLMLTSVFVMYKDYRVRMENYEVLRPKPTQPFAIVPPTPLSVFVKGLDENMGRSFEITFGGQIQVGKKQQSFNPIFNLFTTPDLLFVIKVICALCAMLFAFDAISGEKGAGTLSLTLSNTVSRTTVILGKWIGGFASFIVPFIILFLVGTLAVTLSPHIQLGYDEWVRIGLLLLFSIVYLAFFFSLGLLISTLTHEPASSLVVALMAWALIIFVIPNLGNTLARQIVNIQSVQQLEMRRGQVWIKEIFTMNNLPPQERNKSSFQNVLTKIHDDNERLLDDYRTHFNNLITVSKNISRLSPTAAFTYLSTDIAGTGIDDEARLKDSVLRYKNAVWNKPIDTAGNIIGNFPPFHHERGSVARSMSGEGMINITIIVLYLLLAFAASYTAFLFYDVR
jgi:ABC-type transport system involved in multi-copper enzyme maturation permease subunit